MLIYQRCCGIILSSYSLYLIALQLQFFFRVPIISKNYLLLTHVLVLRSLNIINRIFLPIDLWHVCNLFVLSIQVSFPYFVNEKTHSLTTQVLNSMGSFDVLSLLVASEQKFSNYARLSITSIFLIKYFATNYFFQYVFHSRTLFSVSSTLTFLCGAGIMLSSVYNANA